MLSGGLEIFGYDVSLRHLPDNLETIEETIAEGAETIGDTIVSTGDEIADTAGFVYDWYAEDSSRIPLAIPVVNLAAILLGAISGCKKPDVPAKVDAGATDAGATDARATDAEATDAITSAAHQDQLTRYVTPDGQTVSGRNFDQLFKDVSEVIKQKDGYSSLDLGTCVENLTPEAFGFWCYGVLNGELFKVENGDAALGSCDVWKVSDTVPPPCGNDIYYLDKSSLRVDDDHAEVVYVLKMMEMKAPDGEIPGIALWDPNIIAASDDFEQSATLLYNYVDEHPNYSNLREGLISGFSEVLSLRPTSKEMAGRYIFNRMKMIGAQPTPIDTPWRALDAYSNDPVWIRDWATPLIHAGAILQMMQDYTNVIYIELKNKLESGEWKITRKGGKLFIQMGRSANSRSVSATEYITGETWAEGGMNLNLLAAEVESAINKARNRCPDCIPSEDQVRNLDPATIPILDFQTVVMYSLYDMHELIRRGGGIL